MSEYIPRPFREWSRQFFPVRQFNLPSFRAPRYAVGREINRRIGSTPAYSPGLPLLENTKQEQQATLPGVEVGVDVSGDTPPAIPRGQTYEVDPNLKPGLFRGSDDRLVYRFVNGQYEVVPLPKGKSKGPLGDWYN